MHVREQSRLPVLVALIHSELLSARFHVSVRPFLVVRYVSLKLFVNEAYYNV